MFNRKRKEQVEDVAKKLLDAQNNSAFILNPANCSFILLNEQAEQIVASYDTNSHKACENSLAQIFPDICASCIKYLDSDITYPHCEDVQDEDGHTYALTSSKLDWNENVKACAMFLRNVDEERKLEKRLYDLAYKDSLTGIPNRAKLKLDFDNVSADIEDRRLVGAVCIFDLDDFKAVNDNYGHNTGDTMLKRIAELFELNPSFKGRFYRLGGDEFVLFYCDRANRFKNMQAMKEFYAQLFNSALLKYTLPNIENSCTLSMGVSFFPAHGTQLPDLLRKADIALYKAKDSGRDRFVFFEEKYDTAQKFKDVYINMQPVLTTDSGTFAYELFDCNAETRTEDTEEFQDYDRTLDAIGINELNNKTRYIINYSKQLLVKSVSNNLPKSKFIIQIRPNKNLSAEMLREYKTLAAAGYSLMMYIDSSELLIPEIVELASFVKLDIKKFEKSVLRRVISERKSKLFVGAGINSKEEYVEAVDLGFLLFQGFYFRDNEETRVTKDVEPIKSNYLRLLKLTSTDDYVNFKEISEIIQTDVALSYKLLRLLNSPAVGLRNRISSISLAVSYLGEENLKKWIGMLALRGVADGKPLELVRLSLIRAQMAEYLADFIMPQPDKRQLFLTGMFSLLHIALDKSKEQLFEEIPVADSIRMSILSNDGPYSDFVKLFNDYEYANWEEVDKFCLKHDIPGFKVNEAYMRALKWYTELLE